MAESKPSLQPTWLPGFAQQFMAKAELSSNAKLALDVINQNTNAVLFVVFAIAIAFYFYFMAKDPDALTSKKYLVITSIFIPAVLAFFLYLKYSTSQISYAVLGAVVGILVVVVGVIYYFLYSTPWSMPTRKIAGLFNNGIIILLIIGALAIYFKVFVNEALRQTGWAGFFIHFLFYIPCLLINFVNYIKQEFKLTPPVVYILFIIELVLALSYYYLPILLQKIYLQEGEVLLNNPISLSSSNIISGSSPFLYPSLNNDKTFMFVRKYSISFWININQEIRSQDALLFKWGSPDPSDLRGNPSMVYLGSKNNSSKGNVQFFFSNYLDSNTGEEETSYIMNIPPQKWNYIVFNYSDNQVDLFVNGNLERTAKLVNQPIYNLTDVVTTGSDGGLYGAICGIILKPLVPFTKSTIANTYNLLFTKNPPLNNLI